MDCTDAQGQKLGSEQIPTQKLKHRERISDTVPDSYNMDHKNRGLALIINNVNFKVDDLNIRTGSGVDATNLEAIFNTMGFKTEVQKNLTVQEMETLMIEYGKKTEHQDSDCFVCAILSHGNDKESVYGTDGEIKIEELVAPFNGNNCSGLKEKPKIFFIQACRGDKLSKPTKADSMTQCDAVFGEHRTLPAESDTLLAYSVAPGYYSWRNTTYGSWFIEALVSVLEEKWQDMDLLSMMTLVCKQVAYDYESQCQDKKMSGKKQIPYIASMLTRKVFFKPKTSQTTERKST